MAVIHTNLLSLKAQQNQGRASNGLSTSLERLSSGLRVNSAKDDAAGQAIANRMEADIRADTQVARGINDGISLMQTAEGSLDGINDLLQRSRELSIQAANGTLSDNDRASINQEFHQLREEIDRIAMGTEAFGKYPLAPSEVPEEEVPSTGETESLKALFGTSGTTLSSQPSGVKSVGFIPAGSKNVTITVDGLSGAEDDIQIFTRDGKHLVGTPISGEQADFTWANNGIDSPEALEAKLFTSENGFPEDASYQDRLIGFTIEGEDFSQELRISGSYNDMQFSYTGDGDHFQSDTGINDGNTYGEATIEKLNIDETKEPLFLAVTGSGIYNITLDWDEMPGDVSAEVPTTSTGIDIVTSANYGQPVSKVTIAPTPSDSRSLGLEDVELDPIEKAREAMEKLREALSKVDDYRGQYGALENRFESAINNLNTHRLATASAQSRILDADYAVEAANLARSKIFSEASNSVLAQANQLPSTVLSLIDS